jgi:cobalt-zinc-cadmium efflux system outer membrane protein
MKIITKIKRNGSDRHKKHNRYAHFQVATASGTLLLLASCQTFEPRPADLSSYAQNWKKQIPSDEKVRVFAQRISTSSRGSSSFNPANGISLHEGKMIALLYNPDLRVARLKAGVAKATAKHAGRWDDPELSFDVLKITEGVPSPWVVGSSISLTLPLSGRLKAEKSLANAEMHTELDRVAETEWKVTHDLQKSWLSWSALRIQLDQTRKIVTALDSVVKSTSALAEKGELPRTESALFSIEQTSRRVELERLKGEVEVEEQKIRTLLGLSPTAPIRLIPGLAASSRGISETRMANNNPTMNRLRSEYEVAERTLFREIRKQYPDLQIGPQAEKDQGQSRIGFIGAIPLPILNANKGGIAKARAQREVAQAAYETEYQRKVGKLAASQARRNSLRAQRSFIEGKLIPLVDQQVADAQRLLQLGEGGSLVLLESTVRSYEAKLKIINIQLQHSKVETDIQFLLGPANQQSK